MTSVDSGRTLIPTAEDVASFQRDYPDRPGALQLDAGRFQMGMTMLPLFVELGGLKPSDDVLEVGCGAGRMAYALTEYLEGGSYEGFDSIEGLIQWAQGSIGAAFPSFHFQHVPVANRVYFPEGPIAPGDFTFPYPDNNFDFAVVTSVFTHMRGREIRHYLSELTRVLRPGGRLFTSWFLLDDETDAAIDEGRALFSLRHPAEDGYTHEPENPDLAMGYRRDDVLRWAEDAGFVSVAVHEGTWRGRPSRVAGLDLIVAQKSPTVGSAPKAGSASRARNKEVSSRPRTKRKGSSASRATDSQTTPPARRVSRRAR